MSGFTTAGRGSGQAHDRAAGEPARPLRRSCGSCGSLLKTRRWYASATCGSSAPSLTRRSASPRPAVHFAFDYWWTRPAGEIRFPAPAAGWYAAASKLYLSIYDAETDGNELYRFDDNLISSRQPVRASGVPTRW